MEELKMRLQGDAFLPSQLTPPPHLLKKAVDAMTLGLSHVSKPLLEVTKEIIPLKTVTEKIPSLLANQMLQN